MTRQRDEKPGAHPEGGAHSASCFSCQGRERSEWCVLEDDDLRVLDRARTSNTYRAGQVIFYQGNACLGLYCIEEGEVALRKADEAGHDAIVRLAHAGQTLGYRAYFAGTPYAATAEALTECRICFVDRAAVRQLLDRNPALGYRFLHRAAVELEESEESRLQVTTLSVRTRLAHLLLALKDRRGRALDNGELVIELPLARQDLAALLGARPETISRAIRALEDDGVAHFDGREVRIADLDALLDELDEAGLS
jgi:CRP/FNR family transcriptional regulator